MAIDLTEAAKQRVIALNTKEEAPERWLKLGIRGGGCSGFMYSMDFVEAPGDRDKQFEFDEDVRVCVDRKSYLFLNGITLDFEQSLMKTGFVFVNPSAKKSCSCGESFTL
ncbi:MAG: iron-sulfur cluster assembly protein [Myxococcota bacterium]|jgi:iron-sulfur cluster assembly protein